MLDPQLHALVRAYGARTAAIRAQTEAFVTDVWQASGSWHRGDIARIARTVAPVTEAAQHRMAALTDLFLAQVETFHSGRVVPPRGVTAGEVTSQALRGVDAVELFERTGPTVGSALAKGDTVARASGKGLQRLQKMVAANLQLSKTRTSRRVLRDSERVVGYRRVLNGPVNCGLCVVASTQRYRRGDLLPIHPGCVPGDTIVEADGVLAVTRRHYAGEVVILRTADGDEVAVTPNHPVLTDQGWIPAHRVREGDHLFRRSGRHRVVDGRPAERHRPATAEDVWRAASVVGLLLRMPLAPEDLHGDGADGEIDVVWTDSHLPSIGGVTFGQPAGEGGLVGRHGGRLALQGGGTLAPLGQGGLATSVRLMGSGQLGDPLLGGHLGCPELSRSAAIPRFDAPSEEFTPKSAPTYARRGLDLQRRLAGEVERHRVVELRRVGWSGHVYNLHTAEGWYSASNHIVSNCDCSVLPIHGDQDPGWVIDEDQLDSVHAAIEERFGAHARSAGEFRTPHDEALHYRDLLVVNEHGELGPVLGVRGQDFTAAADLA